MKEEFYKRFGSSIHVSFNWECLLSEFCKVGMIKFSTVDLNNWYTPWYIDSSGFEVQWDHAEAKPLSLNDVSSSNIILTNKHKIITIHAEGLTDTSVEISIPMYSLGDNKYLILDGNHRLLAISIRGVRATVYGYVVYGPLDERMVPDLRHFMAT